MANLIIISGYLQNNPAPASNGVDDQLNWLRAAFIEYSQTTAAHMQQRTTQNESVNVDDLDDVLDELESIIAFVYGSIASDESKRHFNVFVLDLGKKYK